VRVGLALLMLSLSLQGEGRGEGDPTRGRELVIGRETNCVLCHDVPGVKNAGNLGPPLGGVGSRLDAAQLRLRIEDSTRLNPETIMPSYHRVEGLQRVARELQGKPILTAQEVEHVVSYLETLK
jgi:sulfur-oxidizing protein SoxX